MGLFSNKISREKLKPGDHIYSWRKAYSYSHHGIYVGDGEVIHFTRGGSVETGTGTKTFWQDIIVSSLPTSSSSSLLDNPCLVCGNQSTLEGVISSCLDCFLSKGKLYLYAYGVTEAFFMAKPRGGTCTTALSDSSHDVLSRAKYLLSKNGFGAYNLITNNCEDFAIYCKTGLVGFIKMGSSGQAHSVAAASSGFSLALEGVVKRLPARFIAKYLVSTTVLSAASGVLGGACLAAGYSKYCKERLRSDIGMREDVIKVPVERLVEVVAIQEDKLDDKNVN